MRVALVVGASSGLGAASAAALADHGLDVALAARGVEQVRAQATTLAEQCGVRTCGVGLDVTDQGSVRDAVTEIGERLGQIDVLVLNGGGPPPGNAAGLDVDIARSAAELLLYGHLGLINATLPVMRERGWGRIVAIGSSAVQQPIAGLTTSSMFRAALAAYLKLLAAEVAADGVTVNMVLPGRLETNRIRELDSTRAARTGTDVAAVRQQSEANIPVGRYGRPDELGCVVAFLASAQASYVTGEQIRVDGGMVTAP